jgi:hypothetical protein
LNAHLVGDFRGAPVEIARPAQKHVRQKIPNIGFGIGQVGVQPDLRAINGLAGAAILENARWFPVQFAPS